MSNLGFSMSILLRFIFFCIISNSSFGANVCLDSAPEGAIRVIPAREGIVSQSYCDNSHPDYRFSIMTYDYGSDGQAYELDVCRFYFEYYFSNIEPNIWQYIYKSIESLPNRFPKEKIRDICIHSRLASIDFPFQELKDALFSRYSSLKRVLLVQHWQETRGIVYKIFYQDGHYAFS